MLLHKGFYLIEVTQNQVTSHDGSHSNPDGVSHAFNLYQSLGWVKDSSQYYQAEVLNDVENGLKSWKEQLNDLFQKQELKISKITFKDTNINKEAIKWCKVAQDFIRNK